MRVLSTLRSLPPPSPAILAAAAAVGPSTLLRCAECGVGLVAGSSAPSMWVVWRGDSEFGPSGPLVDCKSDDCAVVGLEEVGCLARSSELLLPGKIGEASSSWALPASALLASLPLEIASFPLL